MREIYVRSGLSGFQTNKVDSIAASGNGKNLFVGTTEGALVRYDCQYGGSSGSSGIPPHPISFFVLFKTVLRELVRGLLFHGSHEALVAGQKAYIWS